MRGATNVTLQTHQILRLPRKMTTQHLAEIWWKQLKRHFQCAADPRPFREWSETVPRMNPSVRNPPRNRGYFSRSGRAFSIEKYNTFRAPAIFPNFTKYCACHEKWHLTFTKYCACHEKWHLILHQVLRLHTWASPSSLSRKVTLDLHQVLRLPRKVTLDLHQVLRLPRKVTLDLHQVLPARKVTLDLHQVLRLSRHLTFTKYCACHTEWLPCLILVTYETSFTMRGATSVTLQPHQILRLPRKMTTQNLTEICWKQLKRHFQCAADPRMIRAWSDHEPVSPQPAAQQRLLFALRTSILYWKQLQRHFRAPSYLSKFHQVLRLPRKVTPVRHASTAPAHEQGYFSRFTNVSAPATKRDYLDQIPPSTVPATKSATWPSPSTAPATKSDTWPSPGTALATKCNTWLYYYSAILLLDSTIIQRFYYLTLLLVGDSITWL